PETLGCEPRRAVQERSRTCAGGARQHHRDDARHEFPLHAPRDAALPRNDLHALEREAASRREAPAGAGGQLFSTVRIGAPAFLRNTTRNFAGCVALAFLPTT